MTKKKTPKKQMNTYQEVVVDLKDISDSLTDKAKRFVFWVCFPGADTFQNKTRAAIAAGYAPRNAHISGYKLCKNPKVQKEIDRISKNLNTETIDILYRKYIASLENRAFFDMADYVSGASFKPVEEIAEEKRLCLDQPIFNSRGEIMGYQFGNRRAALLEVKEIYERQNPGGGDDQYDDEEVIRIMTKLSESEVYIERRRKKDEMAKRMYEQGHIDRPENVLEEL